MRRRLRATIRATAPYLFAAMSLISIVYVSSARRLFSEAELNEILKRSRENNARDGITGLLLYSGGNFMQAIEGEAPAIEALKERISADPRHNRMTIVFREEIVGRRFGDWTMAFRRVESLPPEDRARVSTFLTEAFTAPSPNRALVFQLLERFRETMRD